MELKHRPFENWAINRFHARSPDDKYSFWIPNGFWFFHDEGKEQLLSLLSFWEKLKVWRALREEMKLRISELLNKNTLT